MRTFKAETELRKEVERFVHRKGFKWQVSEMQFYHYRMDLYCFSEDMDLTVAVELKLSNWKRALRQASIYQLCADLVYIAMPEEVITRIDKEFLVDKGIGAIAVSDKRRCKEVVRARQSNVIRQHYRKSYIDILRGRERCLA